MAKQLRVALYGRHSVDSNNERAACDQLRVCREFVERHGWKVVAEYKDEGISGGTNKRPGYQAMCAAAARKEFDLVCAEDLKRFWREPAEQWRCIQAWYDLGLYAVTVSGLDMRDKNFKMIAATMGAAAEYERTECSYRIRRGLESNALDHRPTGGRVFGFNPAKVKGSSVTINKAQAKIVKRIYAEYLAGHSAKTIAANLNRDAVPSPGAGWEGRDGKWRGSGVRVILQNARYTGRITWGAHKVVRKASDSTQRKYLPGEKPLTHSDERLRIVDDVMWRAVQRRAEAMRKAHPGRGGEPMRYALSGVLKCSCGGSFIVSGGGNASYVCATYRHGGEHACAVRERVKRTDAEASVFGRLSELLTAPEFLAEFERWFRKTVKDAQQAQPDNSKRLRAVEREIENVVNLMAQQGLSGSRGLADKLRKLEAERDDLATLPPSPTKVVSLMPRLKERYEALLRSLPAVAARDPERARALLLQLTGGLRVVRGKGGLEAEAVLTGERFAAFAGIGLPNGAGGGT